MIFKFQQGGTTGVPPLVSYDPVIYQDPNPRATALTTEVVKESKERGLLDEETEKLIEKLDGLPNDSALIIEKLRSFELDKDRGINTTSLTSKYFDILALAKTAKVNKLEYDNAYQQLAQNGGLNEVAIDNYGRLICINSEGDYDYMMPGLIKEGYRAVTNSELLKSRAYNMGEAYDHNLLSLARNGIGIASVNKMILDIIGNLGERSMSKEGYAAIKNNKIISGVLLIDLAVNSQILLKGEYNTSIDGLYKNKIVTKDQALLMAAAIDYVYEMLPANARTLLAVKAGNEKGVKDFITKLIASKTNSTIDFSTTLQDRDLDNVGTKKKSSNNSSDDTDLKAPIHIQILKSIGGNDQRMLVDTGSGILMGVHGRYYSQIKGSDKNPIINTSLLLMLADSGLLSIISDPKNITFGDLKIGQTQLANITYNNTGVLKANLPINEDGTVRITIMEDYEKALDTVKLLGDSATTELIAQIYKDFGLADLLKADGTPNEDKFAPFIVTEGYTTSKNGIVKSDYIKEVDNPTDLELLLIQRSLTTGTGSDKEVPDIDTFNIFNPFDWFGYEYIYKAAVYIPITNNVNAGVYGADLVLDYDEAFELDKKYRNFKRAINVGTTNAEIL